MSIIATSRNLTIRRPRLIGGAVAAAAALGLVALPVGVGAALPDDDPGSVVSTARTTGITDPLAFLLSEHFPELSDNSGFEIARSRDDRCELVSPLPCT